MTLGEVEEIWYESGDFEVQGWIVKPPNFDSSRKYPLMLAIHGGPLWQPLCYAQIGGLIVATGVTLLLVPVMYSFFVLDLKLVKWITIEQQAAAV